VSTTLRLLYTLLLGTSLVLFLGCPTADDDDDDDDDSSATDDDDDTSTDDDDDTVGDDDTSELPASIEATVVYTDSLDGVPACDMTVDLVGTKYTGYCDGCDFSFDIEATLADDQSTEDCEQIDYFTWYYDGGVYIPWLMIHWDTYSSYYGSYDNLFRSGVSIDYSSYGGGYYVGPYFATLHWDGSTSDTTFTRTGNDIEWTMSFEALGDYSYAYLNDCGIGDWSYAETSFAGDYEMTEEVMCDASAVDVWTFVAVEGEDYAITVDTVDSATTFDPTFHLNDPDGCYAAMADDNFDCTFPPPTFACPSYELVNAAAGAYQVVVYENTYATSECVDGTIGGYLIRIDTAAGDPLLELAHDDASVYPLQAVNVAMTGTITD